MCSPMVIDDTDTYEVTLFLLNSLRQTELSHHGNSHVLQTHRLSMTGLPEHCHETTAR